MKQLLTIVCLLLAFAAKAQTFEELIMKGDKQYQAKEYLAAAKNYEKALEMKAGNSGDYYNAACYWALTGDTIKSIAYIQQAAEAGWRNKKWMLQDSDLTSLHKVEGWQKAVDQVQANVDEYEKGLNKPLKERLEHIHVKDQTLRRLYREAEEKFGRDSEEMKYFWSLVNQQDSLNELEVIEIIDKYGWVGRSEVGGEANMTLWLVIQHAPLETQEKYLPMLEASVKEGESSGSHLALLVDRIHMRNGKPQIYGSQITVDQETGEQVVYEIKEPEYVNQRRAEVGLGPIQEYVGRWGIEWKIEQKEK
ncbi:MAG: hypothetical protein MRY78_07815 [Saprospiraceae bacterium]|nr:hypothetical protein [Saprospiraceae bacterium]